MTASQHPAALRAYRSFEWDTMTGGHLRGYHHGIWLTSEMRAVCDTNRSQDVGQASAAASTHIEAGQCNCGIFGLWAPPNPFHHIAGIVAVCVFGGVAETGADGLRAEYARIERIWAPAHLAADIQRRYPDVRVDVKPGESYNSAPTFARAEQGELIRTIANEYNDIHHPTRAQMQKQYESAQRKRRRAQVKRPRAQLTKKYRVLNLLRLAGHGLTKTEIALTIKQPPLPSNLRAFSGMSEFMGDLIGSGDVVRMVYREPRKCWYITDAGRNWLAAVDAMAADRFKRARKKKRRR